TWAFGAMIAEYVVDSGAADSSTTAIRTALGGAPSRLADASPRAQLPARSAARTQIAIVLKCLVIGHSRSPCRSPPAPRQGSSALAGGGDRRRRPSTGPGAHRSAPPRAARIDCARGAAFPCPWLAAPARLPVPVAPRVPADADARRRSEPALRLPSDPARPAFPRRARPRPPCAFFPSRRHPTSPEIRGS